MIAPPAHLLPYVRVLGEDLAVQFLLRFGGAELYLPVNPKGRSAVAQLVGIERTAALAQAHLPRRVPTARPWIARVLQARGLPVAEIARTLHASDVSVRKWVAAAPDAAAPQPDPRQLPLF